MSIEEIESLVKLARSNLASSVTEEELGPGDLQHFRGISETSPPPILTTEIWSLPTCDPHAASDPNAVPTSSTLKIAEPEKRETSPTSVPFATIPSESPVRPSFAQGLTLEDLGDVELDVTIELGRSELLIEDVLKLREGSVVSLDKLAADPVEIRANGRLIGRGELLVVGGTFGVRLIEVL